MNSIEAAIRDGFSIFSNVITDKNVTARPDSFSTLNNNLLGRNSNNSLNVIKPRTPSPGNKTLSINDSPITVKSDTNNFYSPISPTSTLNIDNTLPKTTDKPLPKIPNDEELALTKKQGNEKGRGLKRFKSTPFLKKYNTLPKNVSELDLTNIESSQRSQRSKSSGFLKAVKSIPFFNNTNNYNYGIVKHLDEVWSNGIVINENNEIVLPSNIKPLNSKQLDFNLNKSNKLKFSVESKANTLFKELKLDDDKIKNNFWIDYDANKLRDKGFIFVEKNVFSDYYNF